MKKVYFFVVGVVVSFASVFGQAILTNASPSITIDFSNTMQTTVGSNPSTAFAGAGFDVNTATAGRLNSNAWAVTGWSNGSLAFGGTQTTANTDYTRGASTAAVSTGGMYAFTGSPASVGNPTLLIQPGGSDWAPGTLTLRIQNNGTTNITQLSVSYNLFVRNDQARSNSFNFSHSSDNTTYTTVPALDYASIEVADALGWVIVGTAPSRSTTITGLNITPTSYYYIRWSGADVSGSNSRDEFGLDDINVTGTFAAGSTPTINTSVPSLPSFGAVVAGANSAERTYTVDGSNLGGDLSIQAPAGVEISLTSNTYTGVTGNTINLTPASGTVPVTNIYARFSPATATGFLNADIIHTSPLAAQKDVEVTGFAVVASPTVQSAISIGTISNNTIDLTLSGGDGLARIVVAKQGSAVNQDPSDGPIYFDGGGIFSNGTDLGSGNFVVYNGSATNIQVTMLTPGTAYHFAVYSYNGVSAGTINYLTPGAVANATTITPTYSWVGGNGSWVIPGNWTPARAVPSVADILQFNSGAAVTVTAVPTETIGKLLISNNTPVTMQASAASTLTIAGGSGTDLSITSGSQLVVDGANAITLNVATGATAVIAGTIVVQGGQHLFTAAAANGITFANGSSFTTGTGFSSPASTGPFGSAASGVNNSVVFNSGSSFIQNTGSNPFQKSQPASIVIFETGSLYRYQQNAAPSFSGRTYANFEINSSTFSQTATGGNFLQFDNLTITDGTLNLNLTGGITIRGNLSVATGEILTFNPAVQSTVYFEGFAPQTITNNGTLTFSPNAYMEVNNGQGVSLNSPLSIGGTISLSAGLLNTTATNILTIQSGGAASSGDFDSFINGPVIIETNSVSPFTVPVGRTNHHPVTIIPAAATASSYRVEALENTIIDCATSNIEELVSNYYWDISRISGADASIQLNYDAGLTSWTNGIPPDNSKFIFIIHKTGTPTPCWQSVALDLLVGDESSGVLTTNILSDFSPFTFGFGDLSVLPVRFGNIKASPQGSGVKVDWSNFSETDVVNYRIERSVNGQPFVTLGTVGARLNNGSRADYSYFDASPVNGINLYRIQSLEVDGKQLYSIIVRVDTRSTDKSTFTIYPNPASAAEVSFQATDLPKGNYSIQVYNAAGQQVHSRILVHAGGFVTESLELPTSTKAGMYHLQIISSDIRLSKSFIIR